ncbi:MAG: DNA-processing protein DprA [Ignavibacteriae bacterium]|nr:DNA-processing protein DprA [Ignavibacteriota bacterium]MCB9217414.1 DNA-protecting protein DprA [Ignavibacteria bacterium]
MLSQHHIIALGFVPGITSNAIQQLLASGLSLDELLRLYDHDLLQFQLKGKTLRSIREMTPYLQEAERQERRADEFGASIVTIADEKYPDSLRQIWSAPTVLYLKGNLLQEDRNAIAIVGTRGGSVYGKITAEKYAEAFVRAGVSVVSGLARGIDTWAHKGTLRAGGRTIAVIASGLDRIQPAISAQLAEEISEQGGVITEYPFGIKALRPYFPQRNRIISGMTAGTVVVESDLKGGALITARFALDQNREIFAVPGPINSPRSNGTNDLIRTDRARLTQAPEDVLESLGFHIPHPNQNEPPQALHHLTAFEQLVCDHLSGEPIHIDDLCEKSGLSPSDLLVTLLSLEFKGLARQMAGKMFLRE